MILKNMLILIVSIVAIVGTSYYRTVHGPIESFVAIFILIALTLYMPVALGGIREGLYRKKRGLRTK